METALITMTVKIKAPTYGHIERWASNLWESAAMTDGENDIDVEIDDQKIEQED